MTTASIKLPSGSRLLERTAPLLVSAALFGLASVLPTIGHRFVPMPVLVVHAGAAISSLLLGALILFRRKGDAPHKALGKTWVALMLITSFTSFGLQSGGHLSAIHFLGILTPVYLFVGVTYARRGDIAWHLRTMRALYVSLAVAGLFAITVPGRALTNVLFGA